MPNAIRQQCIERSLGELQDCLVVGGGINGAVAAAALASRGPRVTLIDRGDFASGTSQESSNLAWGGIKYLETLELGLVWKLCQCRNQLLEFYPHQVVETRFLASVARGFRVPHLLVYAGALLYWVMGRCQTRPPLLLTRAALRRRAPLVRTEQVAGGVEYSDARFVENDARFTFGFVRRTLDHGGNAINYLELTAAEWREDHWLCQLRDRESGRGHTLRARSLVNAAGPFADGILRMLGVTSAYRHVLSKGVHLVVPRIGESPRVLAFFASDGRLFFMIPLGSQTCIGTTDTRVEQATVKATDADIEFLLANANALLALERPLTRADILAIRCGVRPLAVGVNDPVGEADWTALSRRHAIDLHRERNLLTIYGGKLTDCINVGTEVARLVAALGIALPRPPRRWFGEADGARADRFRVACRQAQLDETAGRNLWRRYGEAASGLLDQVTADPALGERVLADYLRVELVHVARTEMVVHLEDFLRRRSLIAQTVAPGVLRRDPGLAVAAEILFGPDAAAELDRYFRAAEPGG